MDEAVIPGVSGHGGNLVADGLLQVDNRLETILCSSVPDALEEAITLRRVTRSATTSSCEHLKSTALTGPGR